MKKLKLKSKTGKIIEFKVYVYDLSVKEYVNHYIKVDYGVSKIIV